MDKQRVTTQATKYYSALKKKGHSDTWDNMRTRSRKVSLPQKDKHCLIPLTGSP